MNISGNDKIKSIFTYGFLPGGGDLNVSKSYDKEPRKAVAINCIYATKGIKGSLIDQAKGGLTVAVEDDIGKDGILSAALTRNKKNIEDKRAEKQGLAFLGADVVNQAASDESLKEDAEFLEEISKKVHKTALFILNLEAQTEEKPGPKETEEGTGCRETSRTKIAPEAIEKVLIPKGSVDEKKIDEEIQNKIIFVDSTSSEFIFSYKNERGEARYIKGLGPISIPDYESVLIEYAQSQTQTLSKKPIYTHVTRLW